MEVLTGTDRLQYERERIEPYVGAIGWRSIFNFLWFTVESNSTSLICNHLHLSKNGLVAGDHSF